MAIATCAILLSFLVVESCKPKDGGEEPKEVEAPRQIVSVDDARKMYNNYTDRRAQLIQKYEDSLDRSGKDYEMQQQKMKEENAEMEKDSFDVARYGKYDIKELRQYLDFVEQEAKKAGVEVSSIRFYFSNYANMEKYDDGAAVKHPRQNSFLLVPAAVKGDRDYAFFVREDDQGVWKPVFLSDRLDQEMEDGLGVVNRDRQLNHAALIPYIFNKSTANAPLTFAGDQSLFSNEVDMVPPPHQ